MAITSVTAGYSVDGAPCYGGSRCRFDGTIAIPLQLAVLREGQQAAYKIQFQDTSYTGACTVSWTLKQGSKVTKPGDTKLKGKVEGGHLTEKALRIVLGFRTRYQLAGFLKAHDVWIDYTVLDFRREIESLERLGDLKNAQAASVRCAREISRAHGQQVRLPCAGACVQLVIADTGPVNYLSSDRTYRNPSRAVR